VNDQTLIRTIARGPRGPIGRPPIPRWTSDYYLSFVDDDGNQIGPAPKNLLGPQGPIGDAQVFKTRAQAMASSISSELSAILILRYSDDQPIAPVWYQPGTSTGPLAFQDINGTWWEIIDTSTSAAAAQTQQVMDRLRRGLDVDILVVSDSTGFGTERWPHQLAVLLAADNPAYTVRSRHWNVDIDNYDSPIAIQTGTGAAVLTVWNYAISGSVAFRPLGADLLGAVRPGTLAGRDADLIFVNYGHNGGDQLERQLGMQAACIGTIGRLLPLTPIIVVGQNPSRLNDAMRDKVRAWQHLVSAANVGFINVFEYFEDYAIPIADFYYDDVHPNAAGSLLWARCIHRAFQYQPDAARSAGVSLYNRGVIKVLSTYDELNTGIASNVTKSKDTSSGAWETEGEGMKITGDGVSAGGFVSWTLIDSANIVPYRGRWLTATAFVRVADDAVTSLGRVSLYDGVVASPPTSTPPVENQSGNRFVGIPISIKVDDAATFVRLDIYAAQSGVPTSESFNVDRIILADGPLPRDSARAFKQDFGTVVTNGNGVAIKHPNGDMVCRKTISVTTAINTAWGSLFRSGDLAVGSWADTFFTLDHVTISAAAGTPLGVAPFGKGSTTAGPGFWLWYASSLGSASYEVTVEGKGRWK